MISPLPNKPKGEKNTNQSIQRLKKRNNTDISEIQQIVREYFENVHSNKMENQEEKGTFPDKYDLPKLNQEAQKT